ncbi:DUF402 domain-containing protein [Paenibacillus pasadenensis]|uniref:DUF402 domain-containing protein n=1 Tax=Paenibacillus pasadenensis TaxID=217090 RepID=UPI00203D9873|nr:DUF402 domain-containing protein [Paenibacillus pasadenensis]
MDTYRRCFIKSFKHDGHLHRQWQRNWLMPSGMLLPQHTQEKMLVLINNQTPITEADGSVWVSRVPAVSFFIPGKWFNVVAMMEEYGIRYYCNLASPPYLTDNVLTYIDYDLDVIRTAGGDLAVVDRDEYERHKQEYRYPPIVETKVSQGLKEVTQRIRGGKPPFEDQVVLDYYEAWANRPDREAEENPT